jgi:hypothetical protein
MAAAAALLAVARRHGCTVCAMFGGARLRRRHLDARGSRSSCRASWLISAAKVAENSRVWRCAGSGASDALDVVDEAHVEHAVGLVEHQRLHPGEVDTAAVELVDQAAGGRHQDLVGLGQHGVLHAGRACRRGC